MNGLVYDSVAGKSSPIAGSRVQFQVRRHGATIISGETTTDHEGGFTIGVHIEQDDVLQLKATAPGYLLSELYLTADKIFAGAPAEIALEAPTGKALRAMGFQWMPSQLDPTIEEWPELDVGGLGRLYLENLGTLPVSYDQLMLDNVPITDQITARRVQWFRIWPEPLPPGEIGIWEIKMADAQEKMRLSLYPREAQPAHVEVSLLPSPLSITYLTLTEDRERIVVFVRNDDPQALIQLEGVSLNGGQVKAEIKQRNLGPGEVGLIIATPDIYPTPLSLACVQVQARIYQGEAVTAWGAMRLLEPYFPIGTWPDTGELDKATLDDLRRHGLDTLILNLPASPDDAFWSRLDDDLRLVAVPRFPADTAQLTAFAEDERILAWFIKDEPEYHLGRVLFGALGGCQDKGDKSEESWRLAPALVTAENVYRHAGGHPTSINLAVYRLLPKYAPLSDIAGIRHLAIDAPGANSTGNHPLEEVLTYTLGLRNASAPAPIWVWTQALCSTSWYENQSACWNRLPTPAEMRAQLYLQLAAGAKGVFWATHRAAFVANGPEQWKEVGRQNCVLQAVRDLLLYGDPAATVEHQEAEVYASAIVSERAVVVPVVNLDYAWESRSWIEGQDPPKPSPPYVFHPKGKLSLRVLVPEWITPEEAFIVTPEKTLDIEWAAEARLVTLSLKRLEDVSLVVIAGDSALRGEINQRLEQLRVHR